jgi:hypothetical protein
MGIAIHLSIPAVLPLDKIVPLSLSIKFVGYISAIIEFGCTKRRTSSGIKYTVSGGRTINNWNTTLIGRCPSRLVYVEMLIEVPFALATLIEFAILLKSGAYSYG